MNTITTTAPVLCRRVYKLGGGTVADAATIRATLDAVVTATADAAAGSGCPRPALVVSAPAGLTDRLCAVADALAQGQRHEATSRLNAVVAFFQNLARDLLSADRAAVYSVELETWARENGAEASRTRLLARGELWNAALIARYLCQLGHAARAVDARNLLRSDEEGAEAWVENLAAHWPATDQVAVVTGFIARDRHGETITLGRDGSDYTAALIAEAGGASELFFFTDTPGIRSADPKRLDGSGQRIACIGHREARTLVRWGGGVLHPRTIKPLMRAAITAYVGRPGAGQALTRLVPGSHWPGGGIGLFVHQATAAASGEPAPRPRIIIPLPAAPPLAGTLERQEQHARERARVLAAFTRRWPAAQCYGDGIELPLDGAAPSAAAINAQLRQIHQPLYQTPRTLPVVLFGPGQVGGEVLRQLQAGDFRYRLEHGVALTVVQAVNSRGTCLLADPCQPPPLDADGTLTRAAARPFIIIDTTAAPEVAARHRYWLAQGCGVVTANKHSLSAGLDAARRLLDDPWFAASTTVGAGLPFLASVHKRHRQGRPPWRFAAVLSGSVNYLLEQLHLGASYTSALRNAQRLGLLEPDPQADLDGWDSARKLLILARALGYHGELDTVQRQPLFRQPAAQDLLNLIRQARANHTCVRYVARWEPQAGMGRARLTLAPECVPVTSPLAVNGCHNVLVLEDENGTSEVTHGPGAGPVVTAEGVVTDVLRIARRLRRGAAKVRAA